METKKAIDFLERLQNPHLEWLKKHNDDIDEIISLLQQGEKYREIIESIKWHIKTSKEINPEVYGWLKFIERIIQKGGE